MNSVQPLDQTIRVIFTLIQSHKANHALQDAGAEGIGVTLPALCQHGQGFFVKVCAVGFVLLESRADADDLPRGTVAVQTELQTGAFGGFHECERFRVFAHQSGAQFCTSGQRRGNARLPGKQHGFFFLCQSLIHLADDRKILPAVHRPTGHDGMLTVKDEVVTVPVADLGRVGDQFGELRRHLFDIRDVQLALIFRRDFEKGTVDDLFFVRPLSEKGFDDSFIGDFWHDLRHGVDTVHILHSSSSILSSRFFR